MQRGVFTLNCPTCGSEIAPVTSAQPCVRCSSTWIVRFGHLVRITEDAPWRSSFGS